MKNYLLDKLARMRNWVRTQWQFVMDNHLTRDMMRYFDWPLFLIVLVIMLFGIVCVFSATSSQVTSTPGSIMEMLETQSTYYPSRQLTNMFLGLVVMTIIMFPMYQLYGNWATGIYIFNVFVLVATKIVAQVGRGGMQAFISVGGESSFQPSELGKVAMIICFAKVFSMRKKPIRNMSELIQMGVYAAIPTLLILVQPDVGTAMVYIFVFLVLVFVSGTNGRLLFRLFIAAVVVIVPLLFYMANSSSDSNFRITRILMWLRPQDYPDDARQIINGQIAIGSGGLFGKGIISPGSFASLGYISDDHTDFIFAIVCESFGLVGGLALVLAYFLLIAHMIRQAIRVEDPYGAYLIFGTVAMLSAHIFENIMMVIGLMPVTGIPLPFVSYGGSNLMTNLAAIGLVENVIMNARFKNRIRRIHTPKGFRL